MNASRLSTGVVIVRFALAQAPHYLLLRAYRYWDFPKGLVETDEDPLTAACREAREETGLVELAFPWGAIYRETPPYRGGKVARYYLARCDRGEPFLPVSAELGRPEHHEWRWASYAHAHGLLVPRVRPILNWAHAHVEDESSR